MTSSRPTDPPFASTGARYACAWVPGFPAAALIRQDPALRGRPVAALRGTALRVVVAVTPEAAAGGARAGMSATEAATRVPDLVGRLADSEAEHAAAGALLDVAWATSPRVEVVEPGDLCLDLSGLAPLFGDERRIGERLHAAGEAVGLPVRIGIGATRTLARLAARAGGGILVVPPGAEQGFLAPRPLALLEPEPDLGLALERWGIGTLGALAALPTAALLARLGPPAVRLQALARGADAEPFVPHPPPEPCREAVTLDWDVPSLPALAFVLDRLLARLTARLALREAGAGVLRLTLRLADGGAHEHRLGLAAPLRDGRTLGRLLRTELETLRLPAPVVAVSIEAEPAPLAALQTDLFALPRPSPRELGEILGRLAALVGANQVGAPAVPDTHRPDAVALVPFPAMNDRLPPGRHTPVAAMVDSHVSLESRPLPWVTGAALVRRRLVPPRPAQVECHAGRPVRVETAGLRGAVVAVAGPWQTTGEWWAETAWARAEWDVALPDGTACRLVQDLATGAWAIDAVYD
jgi:protein ImuB